MLFDSTKLISMRKKFHWSQEDLAAASGISVRTIQRIETGKSGSLSSMKAICAALNVEVSLFIVEPVDRSWVIGTVIGMAGGIIGCSFAYWSIFNTAQKAQVSLSNYAVMLGFITFMLAFTILYPCYVIRKHWDHSYDHVKGIFR